MTRRQSSKPRIAEKTVTRLNSCLRFLEELVANGRDAISSQQPAIQAELRPDPQGRGKLRLVRVRGLGYFPEKQKQDLEQMLGLKRAPPISAPPPDPVTAW